MLSIHWCLWRLPSACVGDVGGGWRARGDWRGARAQRVPNTPRDPTGGQAPRLWDTTGSRFLQLRLFLKLDVKTPSAHCLVSNNLVVLGSRAGSGSVLQGAVGSLIASSCSEGRRTCGRLSPGCLLEEGAPPHRGRRVLLSLLLSCLCPGVLLVSKPSAGPGSVLHPGPGLPVGQEDSVSVPGLRGVLLVSMPSAGPGSVPSRTPEFSGVRGGQLLV